MSEPVDLVIKSKTSFDHKFIHSVSLNGQKDGSFLNPVNILWKALGPGNKTDILQDAVLLIGAESLEVYITAEAAEENSKLSGPAGSARKALKLPVAAVNLPLRLLSNIKHSATPRTGSERFVEPDVEELGDGTMSGGAVESHAFSVGVAFSQLLRIRSLGATITLWYQPNTIAAARLSKNPEAKALRFSFSLPDAEEAAVVVKHLEAQLERYAQAALFLSKQLPFRQLIQITCVAHAIGQGMQKKESLVRNAPAWETTVAPPPRWDQGLYAVHVYLSTPFGAATASISWANVQKYCKGRQARFYVSAEIASLVEKEPKADVIKRSTLQPTLSMKSDANDDGEDAWQPDAEEADDTSGPAPSAPSFSAQQSAASRMWQKRGSTVADPSQQWQIRIHCFAQASGTSEPADEASPAPSHTGGGSLAANPHFLWLAAAMSVLALVFGISHSRLADLAAILSFAALIYAALAAPQSQGSASQSDAQPVHKHEGGQRWTLTLIKAEFTQDSWSADGESMELGATAHAEEESHESLADKLGLTEDQWSRYLVGFHQDKAVAQKAAVATQEWRRANGVAADASQVPQPHYDEIKSWFRHGVQCTTRKGHPVWLMKVGDMKKGWHKFKASPYDQGDINRHISFCMDYLYNHLDTRELPDGRALWLIDLKGMGMTDVGSDAFNFGKEIALTIGRNWPERVTRIFIVHVPGFFSLLWRIVEPMLAANTRKKIRLLRNKEDMLREMKEEMREEDIPAEYGGQSGLGLYDSDEEQKLLQHVHSLSA